MISGQYRNKQNVCSWFFRFINASEVGMLCQTTSYPPSLQCCTCRVWKHLGQSDQVPFQISIQQNTATQPKQTFCRTLTQTQETFENSPNCGKPLKSNSRKVIRQLEEDQCLSSCTWKVNPFFKTQPGMNKSPLVHYGAKWWVFDFNEETTFPQLHDAPMVPENLRCLEDCFDKYIDDSEVQRICSLIGLDRQEPTHTKEGYDLVQSNFSDLVN